MNLDTITCADIFDLCATVPDGAVDMVARIPTICYNMDRERHISGMRTMNEKEICRLYTEDGYTLRRIAAQFKTNHHMIARILTRHGIQITRKGRKMAPFTPEHRRRISEGGKGRVPWSKGQKMTEAFRRANMKGRLYTNIDLDAYPDYDRLFFLTSVLSKRRQHIGYDDTVRKPFLDKFYFDAQFNAIYDAWIASGKNRWYLPTLDHKVSQSNGGSWYLDNLQFLTWFENRAKADMNEDVWLRFCEATNTKSDLFIRRAE